MTRARTYIDKLVEHEFDAVVLANARTYWTPTEVLRRVIAHAAVAKLIADLRKDFAEWNVDRFVMQHIKNVVGKAHQERDAVTKLRIYESYSVPGQHERRWMLLSAMTMAHLLSAMEQTRTQERASHNKGEGYHILMEELEKVGREDAVVADVMEAALPRIMEFRAKSA